MCAHVWMSQRLTSSVSLCHVPCHFRREGLFLNLDLPDLAKLLLSEDQGPLAYFLYHWVTDACGCLGFI